MVERINKIIREKKITAAKFAEIIDVQRSNVSHVLSGRNKPSLDFVLKILENFQEIDPEWLLFGKGDMNRSENVSKASEIDLFNSAVNHSENEKKRSEPVKMSSDQKRKMHSNYELKENFGSHQQKKTMKIIFLYDDRSFEVFEDSD